MSSQTRRSNNLVEFDSNAWPGLVSAVFMADSLNKGSVIQTGLKRQDVYFGIRVLKNDYTFEINFSPSELP